MCKKFVVLSFMVCLVSVVWANVSMENPFSNNMVLQREKPAPVWGTADAGEQVTVDFDGQSKSTTADGNGDWMVFLDPMAASTAPSDLVITGNNVVTITGVQVGEVWVSSGQSNMNMTLGSAIPGSDEVVADMVNHNIRRFKVDNASWNLLTPSDSQASAVHYFFAHELAHNLGNTAGGVIETSVSGSGIEEWTHANGAGLLYETRVWPMQPYAIKGALWYQGETDFNWKSEFYYDRLVGLIAEWRGDWGQGDFPFGIVQLPWKTTNTQLWPVVQDSQLRVHQDVANTGLAVIWDLDPKGKGVHPNAKKPVGERLALWARSQVYGQSGFEYSSPIPWPSLSSSGGGTITIGFDHTDGGLTTLGGGDPFPFKIAGSDGVFEDATATIAGDTVILSSASVPNPETARFVWDYDQGDMFGGSSRPAAVFEITVGASFCGDATCDPGEDECNCPDDCGTPPSTETNCTDGNDEDCDGNTDCDDSDCNGDPACPSCGDATCDPGEDQCNCPGDCGTPPATETNCNDGIDEDCDGDFDCNDPTGDCDTDPACQSACNDNGICEPGEDCNNCSSDCDSVTRGNPNNRYCCGNGILEGPEGDGRCDGNY